MLKYYGYITEQYFLEKNVKGEIMKKYDYLIVGAGLFGAVFAHEMTKEGKKCLVIDKRDHIAGNIYCENVEGINVHKYGAHIFHTSDKVVWEYINQFAEFNNYINSPVARYKDELYNLPFNMNTFSKMLEGSDVLLNTDYYEFRKENADIAEKTVYTGMLDKYFDYKYGVLEYRSVRFETETLDMDNYQGNAVVNYTEREVPYTRIIEHKHFEYGTQPKTVISREYPSEWKLGEEPYYPVNNEKNEEVAGKYRELADKEENVIFGGRLGEYRYYDMDKVIAAALKAVEKEKNN